MAETQGLRTRGDIATAVGRFVGDPSLARREILIDAIDQAYIQALESYRWPQLIRWRDAAVSEGANGDGFIHLPKYVRTLVGISDTTTAITVQEWAGRGVVELNAGLTSFFGITTHATWVGTFGADRVIASASTLRAVSLLAGDTRQIWVRGRFSGDQHQETVNLNGLSSVAVPGSWDEVTQFSVVKGTAVQNAGIVNLFIPSPDTTIATIEANDLDTEYRRYRLEPPPSSAITIRLVYVETPPTIFDDTQQYALPIGRFLFESAASRYFESRNMTDRADRHRVIADQSLLRAMMESGARRLVVSVPSTPPWRGLGRW